MQSITTKELPDWFKLSRYDELERLELQDWLLNLLYRAWYLNINRDLAERRNDIEGLFRENEGPPLVTSICDEDFLSIDKSDGTATANPLETLTVKSLPAEYVARTINILSGNEGWLARRLVKAAEYLESDESDDDLDEFLDKSIDLLAKDLGPPPARPGQSPLVYDYLHVAVDLAAPDKVILDNFSCWLAAARSEFELPAQKIFTDARRDDLVTYRVLPYLDLTLWAALEQVNIPNSVMADALFPDAGVDAPYRVRRVTKPKADWAIQWSVINALQRQILSEG